MHLPPAEEKLMLDPAWRLSNLYSITNKAKQIVKFRLNPIQMLLHNKITRYNKILKARQVGISTYFLLKYLDIAVFNENVTCAILSHDRESLGKLFKIIRFGHKTMPELIRPKLDRGGGSRYRLFFPENNSEIYCTLEAVSDAVSHLHISEAALNLNDDKLVTSMDAVPIATGHVSVETTARGFNHFHEFWRSKNAYTDHFFPWFLDPQYAIECEPFALTPDEVELQGKAFNAYKMHLTHAQIMFRRTKIAEKKGVVAKFLQEYPEDDVGCFIATGHPAINPEIVQEYLEEAREPIKADDVLRIFKAKHKDKTYVCGVDTAEGIGHDYSVATLFEAGSRELVATLRGHFKPIELAHAVNKLCMAYRTKHSTAPLLGVERNNHGHAVLLELEEHIDYPNLYHAEDKRAGWKTTSVTRPLMIDTFIDAMENKNIRIYDEIVLNECLTLVDSGGKIEAVDGKHDDCIISCSIALQMILESGNLSIYNDIEKLMRV